MKAAENFGYVLFLLCHLDPSRPRALAHRCAIIDYVLDYVIVDSGLLSIYVVTEPVHNGG